MTDFRAIAAGAAGPAWNALDGVGRAALVRLAKLRHLGVEDGPRAREDFPTWLARQAPADQDAALGARRGAAFRAGALPITRFTDPPLPPLSLEQLAATLGLTVPHEDP